MAVNGPAPRRTEIIRVIPAEPPVPQGSTVVTLTVPAVATSAGDGLPRALPRDRPARVHVLVWRAAELPPAQVELRVDGRTCASASVAATRVVTLTCVVRDARDVVVRADGGAVAGWHHTRG